MRAVFLAAILAVAAVYSYHAFADMNFLSSTGRLGPAFFPRIIGVLLVVSCVYSLALDFRRGRVPRSEEPGDWRTTVVAVALCGALVALLEVLGAIVAMVAFLLASLFLLNRGRLVQNLAIGVLVPVCVYLLFSVWLNARLPEGLLPLPL
jgi:hypothetical protein